MIFSVCVFEGWGSGGGGGGVLSVLYHSMQSLFVSV